MRCHSLHQCVHWLLVAGLAACASAETGPEVRARAAGSQADGRVQLQLVMSQEAATGAEADSLVQVLELRGTAGALAATVAYDPATLALGTVRATAGTTLFSGEARPGVLRLTVVGQEVLGAAPVRIAFLRRRPGAVLPRLQRVEAASLQGGVVQAEIIRSTGPRSRDVAAFPVVPASTVEPTPIRGAAIQAPGVARFGDINGDGRLSVADVVVLGQATVGVRTIIGDAFVAANVAPNASAGRPTGLEADGQSRLSVSDLTLLNQATVGTLIGAVGQVIPSPSLGPRLLVTPLATPVAARTSACTDRLAASAVPFANPSSGEPWPECVGGDGLPMVVQFCVYEKTADLRWHASLSTASAPRCLTELPQVQRGGL